MKSKKVYGVGINDADYKTQTFSDGAVISCKYYKTWKDMLMRCYSEKYQKKHPTYYGCSVCDEWLVFSNFKSWMVMQQWAGKQLDKDIIVTGCKVYSPETCAFVDHATNSFTTDSAAAKGKFKTGVSFDLRSGRFTAQCRNSFTNKRERLGFFDNPEDAHLAWKKRKHELACKLAEKQSDMRVSEALRTRYL